MPRRARALAATLALVSCAQPAIPPATPLAGLRFAALGDAPYQGLDYLRYRNVLGQIDAAPLAFVIHVGDILWYPCDEKTYRSRRDGLQALSHSVVYTPGDNEWADCHEPIAGGYAPLERLAALRRVFFSDPRRSLGRKAMPLATQADMVGFAEFVENVRWEHEGVVFATLHMPGSWNAGTVFEARTRADMEAVRHRTEAAVQWLQGAFEHATGSGARALVLAMHADMNLTASADDDYQRSYAPLVERLGQLSAAAAFPVLLIHGDTHEYTVDQPLRDRRTGQRIGNLTRLQVMGTPDIGWVEITIGNDPAQPFAFTAHHVPWWSLW